MAGHKPNQQVMDDALNSIDTQSKGLPEGKSQYMLYRSGFSSKALHLATS